MLIARKMNQDEFETYLLTAIQSYADEKEKAEGHSKETALKVSQDSYSSLLPSGLSSENQFLFSVFESVENKRVGMFWFAIKSNAGKDYAYIYDLSLEPDTRGKGYGKELMTLIESEVKSKNLTSIGLHVFGHNSAARKLYLNSGFVETNIIMKKDLV